MLKPSRLQVLNYCWKCKEYKMANFTDHTYLSCEARENMTVISFAQNNHAASRSLFDSLPEEDTIFLNTYTDVYDRDDSLDDDKDYYEYAETEEGAEEEYRKWIIDTIDSYLSPIDYEELGLNIVSTDTNADTNNITTLNDLGDLEEVEMNNTIQMNCIKTQIEPLQSCAICLCDDIDVTNSYYLNCKHGFCKDCLSNQIYANKMRCALCRAKIEYIVENK